MNEKKEPMLWPISARFRCRSKEKEDDDIRQNPTRIILRLDTLECVRPVRTITTLRRADNTSIDPIQFNSIQFNPIQSNSIQFNPIQYPRPLLYTDTLYNQP